MATTINSKTATAAAALAAVACLRIVSLSPAVAFRRAGYAFGREPTFLPLASISKEKVALLKAEPMLDVTETTMPADAAAKSTLADAELDQSKSVDGAAK